MKKELCVKLVIYKDNTKMHGQQNIEVIQFYKTLVNAFDVNKFGPNRTFNIDKNGLSVGQKPSPVINPRAQKQVEMARSFEERLKHYLVSAVP